MRKRLFIITLVLINFTRLAWAQTDTDSVSTERPAGFIYDPDNFIYTDLRYAYTKLGHLFHGGIAYKHRFNVFKIGYSQVNNFSKNPDKQNHLQDLSLLYCWSFRKRNFLFSAGFGVGGIWGNAVTNQKQGLDTIPIKFPPQIQVKTVGFPIEFTFSFTPPPKLKTFSSIGLVLLANFNSQKSYIGAGINLSLGKVSPKPSGAEINRTKKGYYQPKDRKPKWDE